MSSSKASSTRSSSNKLIKSTTEKKHKFIPKEKFPGPPYKLPTQQDVVERAFHERNWKTRDTANKVAKELYEIWATKCNIYPISQQRISTKVMAVMKEFSR